MGGSKGPAFDAGALFGTLKLLESGFDHLLEHIRHLSYESWWSFSPAFARHLA
jgi:hypothetical protein